MPLKSDVDSSSFDVNFFFQFGRFRYYIPVEVLTRVSVQLIDEDHRFCLSIGVLDKVKDALIDGETRNSRLGFRTACVDMMNRVDSYSVLRYFYLEGTSLFQGFQLLFGRKRLRLPFGGLAFDCLGQALYKRGDDITLTLCNDCRFSKMDINRFDGSSPPFL
jgi:hypothetical protein